ncbi:MAG: GTPase HflX [Candidatus Lambdaproteobacteria bacterium]|nr:GTPase HflX [Candidatus Lambdaproteobacteria bacterium]
MHRHKALLLALQTPDLADAAVADSLRELGDLCASLGIEVVGQLVQARPRIDPRTFMGSGKVGEVKLLAERSGAHLAVFDNELSPSQGEHLERELRLMVMDRTQVILEIFGRNARTHESRAQVELAQLEYMLPRLVGMWAHLDRERGGISGSKGAGEKQIDIDRTIIRQRIARLRKELRHIDQERATQKKRRANCLQVSLVGYTNAGKSTLMNRLTEARVQVEDRLFATLDTTTRVLDDENRPRILLSDTVGFIRHLPHMLIASFRSTLGVARDADLLLHVVDLSHDAYEEHMATTVQAIEEIGAGAVPRLVVFNKLDLVQEKARLLLARKAHPEAIFISALRDDPAALRRGILAFFEQRMITAPLRIGYAAYGELDMVYQWSRVDEVRYEEDGIHLTVTSTPANLERIRAHIGV